MEIPDGVGRWSAPPRAERSRLQLRFRSSQQEPMRYHHSQPPALSQQDFATLPPRKTIPVPIASRELLLPEPLRFQHPELIAVAAPYWRNSNISLPTDFQLNPWRPQ